MERAAGEGLRVSKPYGDTAPYDVGVESKGRILRVQVKSTMYVRRGGEYCLNLLGRRRQKYEAGTVDFFAVYLIPEDEWYIIPFEEIEGKTLHIRCEGGRKKWDEYREAWELLRQRALECAGCRRRV